jgi:hypothetical protein
MENNKKIIFIADMDSDKYVQKNLISHLSKIFEVFVIWNAKGSCNHDCHDTYEDQNKKNKKEIDLGHIDLKMFDETIDLLGLETQSLLVLSVNEVLISLKEFSLILVNLPTNKAQSVLDGLDAVLQFTQSQSNHKKALVLFNINDALYAINELKQLFNFYEIISLDYDQLQEKVTFPKSEINKIFSLIKSLG